jgi:Na+-driven multidrug efflux pump
MCAILEKENTMADNLVKQESYFTRREWILRYSHPFKSLMFMAGPMIIIMLVNSLYGIIDKQLTLNFAVKEVVNAYNAGAFTTPNLQGVVSQAQVQEFAKQLINVSTQYSNTIITIIQALALFTSVGTGIRFGQAMGARDKDRMNNVVISGFIQTTILIVVSILVLSFTYQYILTSQAGIDFDNRYASWQFKLSNEYSQMFVFGIPLFLFSNFFVTLLRTEGKVWIVIANNVVCVLLNVMFGTIFMEVLNLGMKGAVFGSMVSWGISITVSVLVIIFSKDTFLRPNFRRFVFSIHDALRIWVVGLSPMLTNIVFAVVTFISTILITNLHTFDMSVADNLTKHLDNYMFVQTKLSDGTMMTEGISDTLRIMSSANPWMTIIYAPIIGMSQGANVNYAYNIGANKRERIVKIFKIHLLINVIWLAIAEILVHSLAKEMMGMFSYNEDNFWWFQVYLAPMIFASVTFTTISLFQGLGNPRNALIVSISRAFLIQITFIVLGWVVANNISTDGSKDWSMFLMNGLQEIPACALAAWMLLRVFRNWKVTGQLIDVPDNFEKPSIADIIRGEFVVKQKKDVELQLKKLKRFKDQGHTTEEVTELENHINAKVEAINFHSEMLMKIKIEFSRVDEAKKYDKVNFDNAKFNEVKTIKECDVAVGEIDTMMKTVNSYVVRQQKLFTAYEKENNLKGMKHTKAEIASANHLDVKLKKAIESFDREKNDFEVYYKKRNQHYIENKATIDNQLKLKHDKTEAKRLAYISKLEQNKKDYEQKLKDNPKMQMHLEKQKNKLQEIKRKELEVHNKRTEKYNNIIALREQKREAAIEKKLKGVK